MHITTRPITTALTALLALAALSACYPSNPHQLGHTLVVHGVVTDSGTGQPLPGVKVTLLSLDNFPSQGTNAQGYFQFNDVLQEQNLLVQFQLAGYLTVTLPVNPTLILDGGCGCDGGAGFPGFGDNVDGFNASVSLSQALSLAVAGTVYSGATLAAGAQVALTTLTGTPVQQTKAGADGTFSFPSVNTGSYELVVLPWDRDGDGLTDTQFFQMEVDVTPNAMFDLGHIAVNLLDVQKALVASSFVSLSRPYPITGAQLISGVTGILQATGGTLSLVFGAEVDPSQTSFELLQFEAGGARFSPPIGLTVTWAHGAVAQLAPASALIPSDASNIGYQLRITSLRFADGTDPIPPSPTAYGFINFTVQAQPVALANPQPALYLANQFTATQTAAKAVFDANTVWLLDSNGDFVFDTVPSANWSSGNPIQLQWPSVPGAVAYHLYMRNTTSPGNSLTGTLDWVEQTAGLSIEPTDPNQTQTIVATGVSPWSLNLGSAAGPWAFGNHIQFAVTSQDALGFVAPIDPNKLLDTADTFGGLVTAVAVDPGGAFPFSTTTELGDTFNKTLRLSFSEPMLTTSVPTVTSLASRVAVKKVLASGWSNGGAPGASLDSATTSFLSLQLAAPGNCTEVTVPRTAGDNVIVVRDASYFTVGATSSLIFLSPAGQFLVEIDGITAVDTTANELTIAPLITGVTLPMSSYACSLQSAVTTTVPTAAGATLTVTKASPFAVGDSVIYYEPQSPSGPVLDVLHVSGVDTMTNTVLVSTAPSAGHTAASVLFPAPPFGTEIALRGSQALTIVHDVPGGVGAQFIFAGPINALAVGDKLLVDADGDLKTTVDQAQLTVNQIAFAPSGTPAVYSLIADLPASITLLHGRAKVIALGDTFGVTATKDTSGNATLDVHRDQITPDSLLY